MKKNAIKTVEELKLLEGKVFANYKDLCEATGLKYSTGGRVFQLIELGRYMKLEKNGWKYLVVEVYDEPKERVKGQLSSEVVLVDGYDKRYDTKPKETPKTKPMNFKGIVVDKDDYKRALEILQANGITCF